MKSPSEVVNGVGEWLGAILLLLVVALVVALLGAVITIGAAVGLVVLAVSAGFDVLLAPFKLFKDVPKDYKPWYNDLLSVLSERSEGENERGDVE